MDYSVSEQVLCELIDIICNTRSVSVLVIHDIFSANQYRILEELKESYTDLEIARVIHNINEYGFLEFIRALVKSRLIDYEREYID